MAEKQGKWKSFAAGYNRFMEQQGFLIVVGVCVAVIIFTAVWTGRRTAEAPDVPTLPPSLQSASQMMQQSLDEAVSQRETQATEEPPRYAMPLDQVVVIQPFNDSALRPSGTTGIYRLHDAVDLAAEMGQLVKAMTDGQVIRAEEKGIERACVTVRTSGGLEITYSGMSAVAGVAVGDTVEKGQTVGFAGAGPADEAEMETHLHLRVVKDGKAVDPALLLTQRQ